MDSIGGDIATSIEDGLNLSTKPRNSISRSHANNKMQKCDILPKKFCHFVARLLTGANIMDTPATWPIIRPIIKPRYYQPSWPSG